MGGPDQDSRRGWMLGTYDRHGPSIGPQRAQDADGALAGVLKAGCGSQGHDPSLWQVGQPRGLARNCVVLARRRRPLGAGWPSSATMPGMALPAFPTDDPATQEAEALLGPPGSPLRIQVREAAAAAQRGKPALSAATARERLSRIAGVSDELRALDHVPPESGL